jgi:hypothetical protein
MDIFEEVVELSALLCIQSELGESQKQLHRDANKLNTALTKF